MLQGSQTPPPPGKRRSSAGGSQSKLFGDWIYFFSSLGSSQGGEESDGSGPLEGLLSAEPLLMDSPIFMRALCSLLVCTTAEAHRVSALQAASHWRYPGTWASNGPDSDVPTASAAADHQAGSLLPVVESDSDSQQATGKTTQLQSA